MITRDFREVKSHVGNGWLYDKKSCDLVSNRIVCGLQFLENWEGKDYPRR